MPRKNPNNPRARGDLIRAYLFQGKSKEAEQEYLEIVKIAPISENFNELSIFYSDQGDFEKALDAIRKAIELKPNYVWYITMSSHLLRLGRLDESIVAATRSVELKSTLETRLWLGDLLLKKGQRNEALQEFQAGFDLASGDARPNFKLAWLYIRMGNKDGALRHYAILKGLVPNQLIYLERSLRAHFGPLR